MPFATDSPQPLTATRCGSRCAVPWRQPRRATACSDASPTRLLGTVGSGSKEGTASAATRTAYTLPAQGGVSFGGRRRQIRQPALPQTAAGASARPVATRSTSRRPRRQRLFRQLGSLQLLAMAALALTTSSLLPCQPGSQRAPIPCAAAADHEGGDSALSSNSSSSSSSSSSSRPSSGAHNRTIPIAPVHDRPFGVDIRLLFPFNGSSLYANESTGKATVTTVLAAPADLLPTLQVCLYSLEAVPTPAPHNSTLDMSGDGSVLESASSPAAAELSLDGAFSRTLLGCATPLSVQVPLLGLAVGLYEAHVGRNPSPPPPPPPPSESAATLPSAGPTRLQALREPIFGDPVVFHVRPEPAVVVLGAEPNGRNAINISWAIKNPWHGLHVAVMLNGSLAILQENPSSYPAQANDPAVHVQPPLTLSGPTDTQGGNAHNAVSTVDLVMLDPRSGTPIKGNTSLVVNVGQQTVTMSTWDGLLQPPLPEESPEAIAILSRLQVAGYGVQRGDGSRAGEAEDSTAASEQDSNGRRPTVVSAEDFNTICWHHPSALVEFPRTKTAVSMILDCLRHQLLRRTSLVDMARLLESMIDLGDRGEDAEALASSVLPSVVAVLSNGPPCPEARMFPRALGHSDPAIPALSLHRGACSFVFHYAMLLHALNRQEEARGWSMFAVDVGACPVALRVAAQLAELDGDMESASRLYRAMADVGAGDVLAAIHAETLSPQALHSYEHMLEERRRVSDAVARFASDQFQFNSTVSTDAFAVGGITTAGSMAYHLTYMGMNDRVIREQLAKVYLKAVSGLRYVAPHAAPEAWDLAHLQPPAPSQRIAELRAADLHARAQKRAEEMLAESLGPAPGGPGADATTVYGGGDLEIHAPFSSANIDRIERKAAFHLPQGSIIAARDFPWPSLPRRVRVGFASAHYIDHTQGGLMAGIMFSLPADKFETHVFFLGKSPVNLPGAGFKGPKLHVLPTGTSFRSVRAQIEAEKLDVLVLNDVGMDPLAYFLAFSRLAPVQALTLNNGVTSGIPETMDFVITSATHQLPGAEAQYTERMILLPGSHTDFSPVELPPKYTREEVGFPSSSYLHGGPVIILCAQALMKVQVHMDDALVDIAVKAGGIRSASFDSFNDELGLPRVWQPKVKLVFISRNRDTTLRTLLSRLGENAHRRYGIPAEEFVHDYILVIGWMYTVVYHAALYHADIVLDSYPFGGGATSLQTLGLGTPLITLPSNVRSGRLTLAAYTKMGLFDCVADSMEGFVRITTYYATNHYARLVLRSKILEMSWPLFQDPEARTGWADALLAAVHTRLSELSNATISAPESTLPSGLSSPSVGQAGAELPQDPAPVPVDPSPAQSLA